MAVDVRHARGLELVHGLVSQADVVVASYKPGDAEKLRLDYATLSALNPRLVYAQITGYVRSRRAAEHGIADMGF